MSLTPSLSLWLKSRENFILLPSHLAGFLVKSPGNCSVEFYDLHNVFNINKLLIKRRSLLCSSSGWDHQFRSRLLVQSPASPNLKKNRVMRMSGKVMSCFAALFLALASVSAVERLNSINDLKKINFGQSVPKHTLLLLHWFANVVDIDSNNIIRLTFDPNDDDFGSHHYGNFEGMLEPTPYGYKYYTVGNLLLDEHEQLPDYVAHPRAEYVGRNWDRIVFRVRVQNTGWQTLQQIDRVFITQHYGIHGNTTYDPEHTYEITNNLLRTIREFSGGAIQSLMILRNRYGSNASDSQLSEFRNTWGNLACLGLLLFIVIQERYNFIQQQSARLQSGSTGGNKVVTQHYIHHDHFQGPRQNQGNDATFPLVLLFLLALFIFAILRMLFRV